MSGRAGAGEAACCVCAQVRAAPVLPDYHPCHLHHHLHRRHSHFDADDGCLTFMIRLMAQTFHFQIKTLCTR